MHTYVYMHVCTYVYIYNERRNILTIIVRGSACHYSSFDFSSQATTILNRSSTDNTYTHTHTQIAPIPYDRRRPMR